MKSNGKGLGIECRLAGSAAESKRGSKNGQWKRPGSRTTEAPLKDTPDRESHCVRENASQHGQQFLLEDFQNGKIILTDK